jgi:hypothetical protein
MASYFFCHPTPHIIFDYCITAYTISVALFFCLLVITSHLPTTFTQFGVIWSAGSGIGVAPLCDEEKAVRHSQHRYKRP